MPKRKGIHSSEDLREDLECPVCLAIPKKGPIYQCQSGHIHCQGCHSGLRECPICRGPIGNTRNLALEKIIAKLPSKCKFSEHGCLVEEKLPGEMMRHERICNFRLVKCISPGCEETITMPDLHDHYKLKHGYKKSCLSSTLTVFWKEAKGQVYRPNIIQYPWFMRTRKHTFVARAQTDDRKFLQFYAYILGSQDDIYDEEYSFEIELKNSDSVSFLNQKGTQQLLKRVACMFSLFSYRWSESVKKFL